MQHENGSLLCQSIHGKSAKRVKDVFKLYSDTLSELKDLQSAKDAEIANQSAEAANKLYDALNNG